MAEAAQQPAAAPEAKPAAGRAKKKERPDIPIYKYYEVKGSQVTRLRKECPRCGHGVFLAEHKDRLTCGKCGYTSYKKARK